MVADGKEKAVKENGCHPIVKIIALVSGGFVLLTEFLLP